MSSYPNSIIISIIAHGKIVAEDPSKMYGGAAYMPVASAGASEDLVHLPISHFFKLEYDHAYTAPPGAVNISDDREIGKGGYLVRIDEGKYDEIVPRGYDLDTKVPLPPIEVKKGSKKCIYPNIKLTRNEQEDDLGAGALMHPNGEIAIQFSNTMFDMFTLGVEVEEKIQPHKRDIISASLRGHTSTTKRKRDDVVGEVGLFSDLKRDKWAEDYNDNEKAAEDARIERWEHIKKLRQTIYEIEEASQESDEGEEKWAEVLDPLMKAYNELVKTEESYPPPNKYLFSITEGKDNKYLSEYIDFIILLINKSKTKLVIDWEQGVKVGKYNETTMEGMKAALDDMKICFWFHNCYAMFQKSGMPEFVVSVDSGKFSIYNSTTGAAVPETPIDKPQVILPHTYGEEFVEGYNSLLKDDVDKDDEDDDDDEEVAEAVDDDDEEVAKTENRSGYIGTGVLQPLRTLSDFIPSPDACSIMIEKLVDDYHLNKKVVEILLDKYTKKHAGSSITGCQFVVALILQKYMFTKRIVVSTPVVAVIKREEKDEERYGLRKRLKTAKGVINKKLSKKQKRRKERKCKRSCKRKCMRSCKHKNKISCKRKCKRKCKSKCSN